MKNKRRDPKIAVLLSLIFPGLGHFYLGEFFNGSSYMVAAGILWLAIFSRRQMLTVVNPVSLLFWFAMAAVYFYAAAECYRRGSKL